MSGEFLEALFAPYRETEESYALRVEMRCLWPGGAHAWQGWFPLDGAGLRKVAAEARLRARQWNVYYGVLPRRGQQGTRGSVERAAWVWCDVDGANWEQAWKLLEKTELVAPHIGVESGHGVHCYWRLDQPKALDEAGKEAFRNVLRRLCLAIGGEVNGPHADMASTDVARILRLPGTWNHKEPERPLPVTICWWEPEKAGLPFRWWESVLPAWPRDTPARRETRLCRRVTHPLLRTATPVGERHRNCVRLLIGLRRQGCSREELETAGRAFCALNAFPTEEMEAALHWAERMT